MRQATRCCELDRCLSKSRRRCIARALVLISCVSSASGFLPVHLPQSLARIGTSMPAGRRLCTSALFVGPKRQLRKHSRFSDDAPADIGLSVRGRVEQSKGAEGLRFVFRLRTHADSSSESVATGLHSNASDGPERNRFLHGLTRVLTAPTLLPTSVHPLIDKLCQIALCGCLYAFHVLVLCTKSCTIPIPFTKLGSIVASWETVSGTAMLLGFLIFSGKVGRSWVWGALVGQSFVSKDTLPSAPSEKTAAAEKKKIPQTLLLLGVAYFGSGYVGQFLEIFMCVLAALDVPMTLGMCRALQVLISHLFWVAAGSKILQHTTGNFYSRGGPWYRCDFGANLFWTVTGGYWLTSYISSVAIHVNGLAAGLPVVRSLVELLQRLPESPTEMVMDQLRANDGGDATAQLLGSLGPCFTGPIWEELLYRGFLLRALSFYTSLPVSIEVSSLVFALNHMNARAFAHLYILGYVWAVLYVKTRNLLVPILIHMMWNGRTFISPV